MQVESMSELQEFSRDVVPVVLMIVGILGLFSVVLLWLQIKEATKWNKLQGQAAFLNRDIDAMERDVRRALQTIGIDWYGAEVPVTDEQAKQIADDIDLNHAVKVYVNALEDIAAAVRIGFVDEDFAYALESVRLVLAWRRFEPYANLFRGKWEDDEIFIELENVALRWSERAAKDAAEHTARLKSSREAKGLSRPKA